MLRLRPRIRRLNHSLQRNALFSPLAGVVEKIAEHLFKILLFALKLGVRRHSQRNRNALVAVDPFQRPHQRLCGCFKRRDAAKRARTRHHPRPIEIMPDLITHDLRLLRYFGAKLRFIFASFVGNDR